ncbi:MAG: S-methyl-5-thioribose-1-phosphate isomerase [Myxococcota bacterium]
MSFDTLRWAGKGIELLDQRVLPLEKRYLRLETGEQVARAIEDMVVRGAPAIGDTAAMGVAIELARAPAAELGPALDRICARLRRTRPTAVNLSWALDRVEGALRALLARGQPADAVRQTARELATQIVAEDLATCRAIGDAGAPLVPPGACLLTHCNAGALATAGYGTALGVVRSAHREGRLGSVLADETRPFLQGARLTAWELAEDGIPVRLITDSMAGALMQRGDVDLVVVGADRIAANGDVANKIGTYPLAVLARRHALPFYVAAPLSTVDLATPDGAAIPIEERSPDEVLQLGGARIAPAGVTALHPAFDVTPADLVTAIITEAGVARPPYPSALRGQKTSR